MNDEHTKGVMEEIMKRRKAKAADKAKPAAPPPPPTTPTQEVLPPPETQPSAGNTIQEHKEEADEQDQQQQRQQQQQQQQREVGLLPKRPQNVATPPPKNATIQTATKPGDAISSPKKTPSHREDLFLKPWPSNSGANLSIRIRAAAFRGGIQQLKRKCRLQFKNKDDDLNREEMVLFVRRAIRVREESVPEGFLSQVFDAITAEKGTETIKIADILQFAGSSPSTAAKDLPSELKIQVQKCHNCGGPIRGRALQCRWTMAKYCCSVCQYLHWDSGHRDVCFSQQHANIKSIMSQAEEVKNFADLEAKAAEAAAERETRIKNADAIIDKRKKKRAEILIAEKIADLQSVEQSLMGTQDLKEATRRLKLRQQRQNKETRDAEIRLMEAEDEVVHELQVLNAQANWLAHASHLFELRHGRQLPFDSSISAKHLRRCMSDTAGDDRRKVRPLKRAFIEAEERIREDRALRKSSVFASIAGGSNGGERIYLNQWLQFAITQMSTFKAVELFETMDQKRVGFLTSEEWKTAFVCLEATTKSNPDSKKTVVKILKSVALNLRPRSMPLHKQQKEWTTIALEDALSKKENAYFSLLESERERVRIEEAATKRLGEAVKRQTFEIDKMRAEEAASMALPPSPGAAASASTAVATSPSPEKISEVAAEVSKIRRAKALHAAESSAKKKKKKKAATEGAARSRWRS